MKTSENTEGLLRLARQADERANELKRQARSYVLEAHACGASWSDIGAAFGITRQAAHERFHGVNRRTRRVVRHSAQTLRLGKETPIDDSQR